MGWSQPMGSPWRPHARPLENQTRPRGEAALYVPPIFSRGVWRGRRCSPSRTDPRKFGSGPRRPASLREGAGAGVGLGCDGLQARPEDGFLRSLRLRGHMAQVYTHAARRWMPRKIAPYTLAHAAHDYMACAIKPSPPALIVHLRARNRRAPSLERSHYHANFRLIETRAGHGTPRRSASYDVC